MNLQHFLTLAKDSKELSGAKGLDLLLSLGKKHDTLGILAVRRDGFPKERMEENRVAFAKQAALLLAASSTRAVCLDRVHTTISAGKGRNMLTTFSKKLPILTPVYDTTDDFV